MRADRVAEMLRAHQQPALAELAPIARGIRHENWRLDLVDGSALLLRTNLQGAADDGLQREFAAHQRLRGVPLPTVATYQLIDEDRFGTPASLSTWLPGSNGAGVMNLHPELTAALCETSGRLMAQLEQNTQGTGFASTVVDGRFRAIRPNWAFEYFSWVSDAYARAHAAGADLGPLFGFMLQRVEQLLPALQVVNTFTLVHGDLRPENLLLDVTQAEGKNELPTFEVCGVIDWEFASMGDPLLAFAMPLELPAPALAKVIEGYGRERVEQLVADDAAMQRLEAYGIGRLLQFMAYVIAEPAGDAKRWGRKMAHAARLASERAVQGYARRRMKEALAIDLEADWPEVAPPQEGRAITLRAVGRLASRPVVGPSETGPLMGALAAVLYDDGREVEGWTRDGVLLLERIRPGLAPRGFEPLRDRVKWLSGFDRRVAGLQNERALGVFWLACAAMIQVGENPKVTTWPVRNHALRGLQSLIEVVGSESVSHEPKDVLFDALLGLAAEQELARIVGRPLETARQVARLARIQEAWEDLTLFSGHTAVPLDPEVLGADAARPTDWKVPVILLATSKLTGLPVSVPELIGVVCR